MVRRCRLCIVEVQGIRVPMASCTLPVSNGMVVETETEALKKSLADVKGVRLRVKHRDS